MIRERITLTQFIIEEQRRVKDARGDFSVLLNDIVTACKTISHRVSRGGLGADDVDLRVYLERAACDAIVESTLRTGRLAGISSKTADGVTPIPAKYPRGNYLLVFDPLNGSGNLDINFMSGTIFSVLRAPVGKKKIAAGDFLQAGNRMVAAGFMLYGASTRLVLTTGNGVNVFMLDREIGEFVLTHAKVALPDNAATFAINASNERFWEPPVRRYVKECLAGKTGPRGRDFGMRWVASLIAEAYRVLVRGGVFLYPVDARTRDTGGRLGLLHEANPIAFIMEQAGGGATTGRGRILDVAPADLHQRTAFIFGSKGEVELIQRYHQDYVEGRDSDNHDFPLFGNRSLFLHE
ncbi:MAG: fructose-bisphosphatase [Rhodocyclales bacterium RIFCSPLOWO2_02_FULL_63_24]|nr:MAG: fructose-bisphosphatase [Rhodocyclales bacterium GWA2_65_19]OHC71082.1 MAG: fructose-bisphosphatase [Rhodocyclales bacterium RIFCSPLOWO2_02_FULL_63_24]